jgi:hypothetical protein
MYKSWMWKQRSFREQFQGDEGNGSAGGSAVDAQQVDESQEQEGEQSEGETPEGEQSNGEGDDQSADDGVIVTIGDETPPAANDDEIEGKPAPQWVKELRKSDREKAKRIRELEQQVAAGKQAAQPQRIEVGEKPTLESCDYDAEAYGEKLVAWNERKKQVEAQAAKEREEQEAASAAWQKKLDAYRTAGAALKVQDFDGAEHVVRETMSQTQQAVIVSGADKPELVVYALGSNPAKAKELASIKDPVKFAFAVAKLEAQLKVQPRKAPPAPERQVRGTAGGSTGIDNRLAALEAEADRTGDRSKVVAYKREQREKSAA